MNKEQEKTLEKYRQGILKSIGIEKGSSAYTWIDKLIYKAKKEVFDELDKYIIEFQPIKSKLIICKIDKWKYHVIKKRHLIELREK